VWRGDAMSQSVKMRKHNEIKEESSKRDFLIESLKIVVDGIARTFGSRCEVVLHDMRSLEHSIVKIENGHVTGRAVGGSVTDNALKHLKSGREEDLLLNYPSVTTDGRHLKSSTIVLRDENRKRIAAFCVNIDMTDMLNFDAAMKDMFKISEETPQEQPDEIFEPDVTSTLDHIAGEVIVKAGVAITAMGRKERMEVVRQLEKQGFFMIKGAVKLIARKLNVSKYAVYDYLDAIRSER
jgi:predicted transcriptional regulator YheO